MNLILRAAAVLALWTHLVPRVVSQTVVGSGSAAPSTSHAGARPRIRPGDGPLYPEPQFAVYGTSYCASGDLNGDGKADLVTVFSTHGVVSVLLGNGYGLFRPRLDFATSTNVLFGVEHCVLGDIDHDGDLDVVMNTLFSDRSYVAVMRGHGNGALDGPVLLSTGGTEAVHLALGDVDEDGHLDLVTANVTSRDVSVLRGDGNGSFVVFAVLPAPGGDAPDGVALHDLDGDMHLDLVVAGAPNGHVSVLAGNGDATFAAAASYQSGAGDIHVGDVDGDGDGDLVAAISGGISVIENDGTGAFGPSSTYATIASEHIALGDVDRDGDLDVASGGWSDQVAVVLGLGDGSFGPATVMPTTPMPRSVQLVDVDRDGAADLIAGSYADSVVSVFHSCGNGTFDALERLDLPPGTIDAVLAEAADLDRDGDQDLVVLDGYMGRAHVYLGTGGGELDPPATFAIGGALAALAIADFDGDGRFDLATAGGNSVRVLVGNGNGTFAGPTTIVGAGGNLRALVTGDLDLDGDLDLVVSNASRISVLVGAGNGTFAPPVTMHASAGVALELGDLDLDGDLDLVAADQEVNAVRVFLGASGASFVAPQAYGSLPSPTDSALGDFDHDGDLDIAVATSGQQAVAILTNDGRGQFVMTRTEQAVGWPYRIVAGLLDGDAHVDLAFAAPTYSSITVLLGAGDGTFLPPGQQYAAGGGSTWVSSSDFDGDGDVDLLAVPSPYDVSVLRNLRVR
ncbi:MAG: FG-GAP repeat domain-containing protein [Planctomycetota bacterium]